MKLTGNKKIVHISFILAAAVGISLVFTALGGWIQTGSAVEAAGTPGIIFASLDYVDEQVNELSTKINELSALVKTLDKKVEAHSTSLKFEVIELKAGQTLIAGESAEFIVRTGSRATAIAGTAGGLSDITAGTGKDIMTGEIIPQNHLVLVSRDDGRGLKAESQQVFLLFKGTYEIK